MEAKTVWRCTIEVDGEDLHYEKFPSANTINIYNVNGENINCFTQYDLDTIEKFEAACIGDAEEQEAPEEEEEETEEEDEDGEDYDEDEHPNRSSMHGHNDYLTMRAESGWSE